jgi:hypothetical protein
MSELDPTTGQPFDRPISGGTPVAPPFGGFGGSDAAQSGASDDATSVMHGASGSAGGGNGLGGPDFNPAPKASKAPKLIGIGLGVALLAGGGFYAYTQLVKEKSNTPTQAVESFYTALANGDAIGLAETLDPGERDILLDSVVPMVAEMNRLQFFEGADLRQIKGVKGSFTNYKATETKLAGRDDLVEVTIKSGTLVTDFDPKALPLGKNIKDALKDVLDDSKKTSTTKQLKDTPFVVHKTGSRWYVSANYSIGEAARRSNGKTTPLKTAGTVPNGAATPEAAVADMMQAVADINVKRMIELMPPSELPALQNYSDWFLPEMQQGIADVDLKQFYALKFTPQLRSESAGKGRATVFVEDLPMNLKVDTEIGKLTFNYKDSTFDLKGSTSNGDNVEAKYIRGDFNSRLMLTDGTKVTAKRTKNDFTGTFDGSDGSQGRATYVGGKFDGSVNLEDGTNGTATFRDGQLIASVNASDGTKGTFNLNNKTKKVDGALTFSDGSQTTLKFADECLTIASNGEGDEQKACGKKEILDTFFGEASAQLSDPRVFGQLGLDQFFPSEAKQTAEQKKTCARKLPQAKIGFSTVQIDGKWYVSPMRTMLDSITAQMKIYEPKDIDCLRTQFNQIAEQVRDQVESQLDQRVESSFNEISNTLPGGDGGFTSETLPGEDPFSGEDPFTGEDPLAGDTGAATGDSQEMTDAEFEELLKSFDTMPTVPDTMPVADTLPTVSDTLPTVSDTFAPLP